MKFVVIIIKIKLIEMIKLFLKQKYKQIFLKMILYIIIPKIIVENLKK